MSYEGFTQYWCENGHYFGVDVYDNYNMHDDFECPHCDGKLAFSNNVNTTNGSFDKDEDGNEIRVDGYIEPIVKTEAPTCECHCGHVHLTGPPIYEIPTAENTLVASEK